jgi:siroheme synthase (precorrin-2 oxidase/ferrochelatase)
MSEQTSYINESSQKKQTTEQVENNLLPVFLKLENLRLLIVGGGHVGFEKLNTVVHNSPATKIRLVATSISHEIKTLAEKYSTIEWFERPYFKADMDACDIIMLAPNDLEISAYI